MTVLAQYPSKSKPGQFHEVRMGEDGVTYCTCWAWKKNKRCAHIERYKNQAHTNKYVGMPNNAPIPDDMGFDDLLDDVVQQLKGR